MRRLAIFIGVSFSLAVSAEAPAAPREWGLPIPAPYQLVGIEQRLDEGFSDRADGLTPPRVVVDLGAANGPPPADEDRRAWIVLGTRGWAKASKYSIEKRCEYLCGEEGGETCSYVAILEFVDPNANIGAPLAAVPGDIVLDEYETLEGRALEATPLAVGDAPSGLFEREKYRVATADGASVSIAFHWLGDGTENVYEMPGENCTAREYGIFNLTETACDAFSILSDGPVPLIISVPDYNLAKATPLASFVFRGSRYFIVRYGAKAQDVIGFVAAAPSGWRGLFRGRDHALLC